MKSIVRKSMKRQNGGTTLGFIVGLVVGLGVAVVVAIMITKTASPFTNKLGMNKAADTPVVQVTDPNKPLYGNAYKEPSAKPGAENASSIAATNTNTDSTDYKELQPDPDLPPDLAKLNSKPDVKDDTTGASKLDNKSDAKAESKNAKPTDNLSTKTNADEKATYYLQVGAFRDTSDAENARAKLALIGVESSVSQKNSEGDSLFRVRIGPFEKVETMNRMRSKLSENSIDVAVIKTPK